MDAVITAGGRVGPSLCEKIASTVKALAVVGGTTMLERAISSARDAGARSIAVVCGDEARAKCAALVDRFIPESISGAENVRRALRAFDDDVLYLSSDLPFLSGATLMEFLKRVPAGTVAMPLAPADAYEVRFPNAPDHATVVGRERIANGSVFVLPAGSAPNILRVADRFFDARKSLLRMALLLGPELLIKFTMRRLQIADIEKRASRVLGIPALAIRDCAPELCYDIDNLADYLYACEHA